MLLPLGVCAAHLLAFRAFRGKAVAEALVAVPLLLPPTVLGFYLLQAFSDRALLGGAFAAVFGQTLAFSFVGLLLASVVVNVPFVVQPIQRAFEAVPQEVRDAAACCGLSPMQRFLRIELPLAWPGILTAAMLAFAHTLGEFGVVLMVGGQHPRRDPHAEHCHLRPHAGLRRSRRWGHGGDAAGDRRGDAQHHDLAWAVGEAAAWLGRCR